MILKYIVSLIQVIGAICSIIVFARAEITKNRIGFKSIFLINAVILLILAYFSFSYLETINEQRVANQFYTRYHDTNFEAYFSGSRIKTVVTGGIVSLDKINYKKKNEEIYRDIIDRYKKANSMPFEKTKYVEIAREIFGIFQSISGLSSKGN